MTGAEGALHGHATDTDRRFGAHFSPVISDLGASDFSELAPVNEHGAQIVLAAELIREV